MNNSKLFKRLRDIIVDSTAVIPANHLCNDYYASNGQHLWSLVAAMALLLLIIPFLVTNLIILLMPTLDSCRKLGAFTVEDEDD